MLAQHHAPPPRLTPAPPANRFAPQDFVAPREVIWLNGAPGSGKGVSTPHIMAARGMGRSVCVSSLLAAATEAKPFIEAGEMIADSVVGDLLLEALLQPASSGLDTPELSLVVDGFPRTAVQVRWLGSMGACPALCCAVCVRAVCVTGRHSISSLAATALQARGKPNAEQRMLSWCESSCSSSTAAAAAAAAATLTNSPC